MKNDRIWPVSVSMPESLAQAARVEAAKLNMSRSAFVTRAVQKALDEVTAKRTADRQAEE